MSDDRMIRLLQRNGPEGLSLLYDQYAKALYGVIYHVLQNTEAAEEVLQDAMMKIWKNASNFDPGKGSFLNWILQIARNAAIDRVRLKRFSNVSDPIEAASQNPAEATFNPETVDVPDLVRKLEPAQREIIELVYFQGYSQSEAAEALGLPLGTLKSRLYNAINKLGSMFT